MNLCLRFVTSTVMGLNLAAILLAAILALPAAYGDEDPIDEGGGDDSSTVNCAVDCHCGIGSTPNEGCLVLTASSCRTMCVCFGLHPENRICVTNNDPSGG